MTHSPDDSDRRVVSLPGQQQPTPPRATRPGKTLGLATAGMAICAVIGILAGLLFVTVGWPGDTRRYVIAAILAAVLGFFLCASMAVLAAARDTYARNPREPGSSE